MSMTTSRTYASARFAGNGSVSTRSLGKPAAAYPGRVATDSDLIIAVDRQQTTLAVPLNATDVSMIVTNAAIVGTYNLLSIDNEIVKTTGPPSGNTIPIQRGFDGTTPALHLASATVSGFVDAWHHNALVAEVEAIENALGPNLSNAPAGAYLLTSQYAFPAQSPGGSLIVGANSITLTPVPSGVNGSDSGHYLYISGGTGTAEAVPIIGGSAVSGATSGTVIVTCANTHSGAWTIQSATAGAQEAAQTLIARGGGGIMFPSGNINIYGPFTAPASISLNVAGTGPGSHLTINQTTGTVFHFSGNGPYEIINLQMTTPGGGNGTPQNLVAVEVGVTGSFTGAGLTLAGFYIYFSIIGSTNLGYIADNVCINPYTSGLGVSFSANGASLGNWVVTGNSISGPFFAGVYFSSTAGGGGFWINYNNIYGAGYGLYIGPVAPGFVGQIFSTSNAYQDAVHAGVMVAPNSGAFVRAFVMNGDNIETGKGTGVILGYSGGVIDGTIISGCTIDLNASCGIELRTGAVNTIISNCIVASNSYGNSNAFPGLLVDAGVSQWTVTGGLFGPGEGNPSAPNTQSYGIVVQPGASNQYSITGAYIPLNVTGSISDGGTGAQKVIANNLGVDTVALPTIPSAASIAVPNTGQRNFYVTGTTTVTTITGGCVGLTIRIIKADTGTLTVGGGGNIPGVHTMAPNTSLPLTWDGYAWY